MGLFDMFKRDKSQEESQRQVNPSMLLTTRGLAVAFFGYLGYETVQLYMAGGEEAPSLGLLIGSLVFFAGGAALIAWMTWKQYKRLKAEQDAAAAELLAEAEAEDEFDDALEEGAEEAEKE